jgi:hypothetical protein
LDWNVKTVELKVKVMKSSTIDSFDGQGEQKKLKWLGDENDGS